MFFVHLVWNIAFWSYRPKNPSFMFQFEPISDKIGWDENLARLIDDPNKMEKANDKNVLHDWA